MKKRYVMISDKNAFAALLSIAIIGLFLLFTVQASARPDNTDNNIDVSADSSVFDYNLDRLKLSGNVRVNYKGISLFSDTIELQFDSNMSLISFSAKMEGNNRVRMIAKKGKVVCYGKSVFYEASKENIKLMGSVTFSGAKYRGKAEEIIYFLRSGKFELRNSEINLEAKYKL